MVAIPIELEDQVPPVVALVKAVVPPIQVVKVPEIAFTVGGAVTTITAVAEFVQALFTPLLTVYVIVTLPAERA